MPLPLAGFLPQALLRPHQAAATSMKKPTGTSTPMAAFSPTLSGHLAYLEQSDSGVRNTASPFEHFCCGGSGGDDEEGVGELEGACASLEHGADGQGLGRGSLARTLKSERSQMGITGYFEMARSQMGYLALQSLAVRRTTCSPANKSRRYLCVYVYMLVSEGEVVAQQMTWLHGLAFD